MPACTPKVVVNPSVCVSVAASPCVSPCVWVVPFCLEIFRLLTAKQASLIRITSSDSLEIFCCDIGLAIKKHRIILTVKAFHQ